MDTARGGSRHGGGGRVKAVKPKPEILTHTRERETVSVSRSSEGHDQQRMIAAGKCQEGGVVHGARWSRCSGRTDLNQNGDWQWPGESPVS